MPVHIYIYKHVLLPCLLLLVTLFWITYIRKNAVMLAYIYFINNKNVNMHTLLATIQHRCKTIGGNERVYAANQPMGKPYCGKGVWPGGWGQPMGGRGFCREFKSSSMFERLEGVGVGCYMEGVIRRFFVRVCRCVRL